MLCSDNIQHLDLVDKIMSSPTLQTPTQSVDTGCRMALSAPAPYYQPPPGLVRYRAKPRAQQLASSRYSGDFDMMMGGRAAHGDRRHPVNNVFRSVSKHA